MTLAFHVNDKLDLSATSLTHAGRAPSVVQSPGAGLAVQVAPIAQLQLPADGSGLQDQDAFVGGYIADMDYAARECWAEVCKNHAGQGY